MIENLLNPEVQKFIQDHQNDDPVLLMLQAGKYPHLPMREIVHQIKARQKLKRKLPEWVQNEKVIFPASLSQEQSSSQKTAIFKSKIIAGKTIADLTGGAGVDTFYFSKVFSKVMYVEPDRDLFEHTKHNLNVLGASNIQFLNLDAEEFLDKELKVDWAYLDPDRRGKNNQKLYLLSDTEPDVLQLMEKIWRKSSGILLKTSPMLDIGQSIKLLQKVDSVYVVAVENEVKEVLYILKKQKNESLKIDTVNFLNDGTRQEFQFDYHVEKNIESKISTIEKYLYEPNTAVLKAGAFKTLTQKYPVSKLHPNTHLYSSDQSIPDFPGRIFEIKKIVPFQKKQLLALLPEKKANITVRNFPVSVEEIRKKTGIKEGGDIYLFATIDITNKNIIICCEKIS